MQKVSRIVITTGDLNGIGLEVTYKALKQILPKNNNYQFVVYRSNDLSNEYDLLSAGIDQIVQHSIATDLRQIPFDPSTLIEIVCETSPADWVYDAARKCHDGIYSAMVTGPLSKTEIKRAGYSVIGHTQMFKELFEVEQLFMSFVGSKFSVVLTTGHTPLNRVSSGLSAHLLKSSILKAEQLRSVLLKNPAPIAVLGLNPHSGEQGLIGQEEIELFGPVLNELNKMNIKVEGPLVPDAAFLPKNWPKYSVFVCPYHDQGLIPFKLVHGQDSGAHITLGLPIIRTSVDHGTAYDLYGKDMANPNSMRDAIVYATQLVESSDALSL